MPGSAELPSLPWQPVQTSGESGACAAAPAVSYMVGKKQYVAVAAGGNTQLDFKRGNSVVVFALP